MNQGREMNQDREFETYLQGKSDLSRQYADLPLAGPPDHLDAAILAEAHRAAGSRPGARPRRRWALPLSMVATLFVVVMVGLQLRYMLKDAALTQAVKEERAAVATEGTAAKPASPASGADKKTRLMAKARSEAAGEPAAMPAPQAPAAPNAPAMQDSPRPGLILQAPAAAKQAGNVSALAAPAAAMPPAPAAAAPRAQAPAETGRGAARSKAKESAARADVSDSLERQAPAAATMAAPEPMREANPAQSLKDEAGAADPEEWLNRIKRLRQAGKLDEARRELAAFKKRYPDYSLPEELR